MPKTDQPLKIAYVYDDSLDGAEGVSQYVKVLGEFMMQRGHSISYLTGQTAIKNYLDSPVYSLAKNIRVSFNGNKMSIPLPANSKNIARCLAKLQPDVLHIQAPYSPFMAQKIINLSSPRAIKVGTFHIYPASAGVSVAARLLRILYGKSVAKFDQFFSVSQPAAEFAQQSFGISSIIVPNMVELSLFRAAKKKNTPGKIVFLGRLVERKGCEYLVRAFAEVAKSWPDATLTIAGDGPQRHRLTQLCHSLGIADRVEFLGFINETDKPLLLAEAQIACFPSLYGESFGIVLIEAMAAGAGAVIGGNNSGYAEVLEHNMEVLFDPREVLALARKIIHLLSDEKSRRRLHRWQSLLVEKYDVEAVGARIEARYYDLIAKKQ